MRQFYNTKRALGKNHKLDTIWIIEVAETTPFGGINSIFGKSFLITKISIWKNFVNRKLIVQVSDNCFDKYHQSSRQLLATWVYLVLLLDPIFDLIKGGKKIIPKEAWNRNKKKIKNLKQMDSIYNLFSKITIVFIMIMSR